MMNKLGISAIVATVLTILITVAAITIIWTAIIPMISEGIAFDELSGRVSIVTQGGYTVYDAGKDVMIVQVKRDVDEGVMNRIKVLFSIEGNSVSSNVVAPESGQTKTYTFDLSGYGEPESVSVAPIFVSGSGNEKEGSVQSKVDVPKNKISDVPVASYDLGGDYFYEMPVTGLVSWWKFNGDFEDSVGGNDGTNNGVTFDDGAGVFDEVSYVTIPNKDIFSFGNSVTDLPFSISSWIYVPSTLPSHHNRIVTKKAASNGEWMLSLSSDGSLLLWLGDESTDGAIFISTDTAPASGWHHIVGTYDGLSSTTGLTLYVDGVVVDSTEGTTGTYVAMEALSADVVIGAESNGQIYPDKMDNIMIYDKVLTEEEITAIYENQKGGKL